MHLSTDYWWLARIPRLATTPARIGSLGGEAGSRFVSQAGCAKSASTGPAIALWLQ